MTRALLVSAPLIGGLACGEPEERVNVPMMEDPPPVPTMQEPPVPTMEEPSQPAKATNMVTAMDEPELLRPPSMVNVRPTPRLEGMVNPGPRRNIDPELDNL